MSPSDFHNVLRVDSSVGLDLTPRFGFREGRTQ